MRFWTSDMHFGHRNIIEYCPSRQTLPGVVPAVGDYSVQAMNEALIYRWNETVGFADQVMILGDAVMGKRSETLPLLDRLNGDKYLFVGNHDKPFEKTGAKYAAEVALFNEVGVKVISSEDMAPMSVWIPDPSGLNPSLVYVAHFPYEGDSHDEDRYEKHRPVDGGYPLLHGHVHDAWKVNGRMINVGVDVWDYRPVAETAIAEIVAGMR